MSDVPAEKNFTPSKPLKRGQLLYETPTSVHKANLIRDRLIDVSINANLVFALVMLACSCVGAWIITQPYEPSDIYVQHVTGEIRTISTVSEGQLPPPIPLDIPPPPAHASLDDTSTEAGGYAVSPAAPNR